MSLDTIVVNWDAVSKTASKMVPAGPKLQKSTAKGVVSSLHEATEESVDQVYAISKLEVAKDLRDSKVLVVDRQGWLKASSEGFKVISEPLNSIIEELKNTQNFSETEQKFLSKVATVPVASMLSLMSTRILGQYDPFSHQASDIIKQNPAGGTMLLVAPTILEIENELGVNSRDFRLFVCIHEQTHRVQFAAAPWLADYLLSKIEQLMRMTLQNPEQAKDTLKEIIKAVNSKNDTQNLSSEAQLMSQLIGVMSLLEGHASYVMNNVDSSVIPSIKTIRRRFADRSQRKSITQLILKKIMNMDAKARQYIDGEKFVQEVIALTGIDNFNKIWLSPHHLPDEKEIHNPDDWVERVVNT